MSITLSGDLAATITAVGTLVTVIGNFALQIVAVRKSRDNGRKLDENTEVTKNIAGKVEEVHAAQVSTSGTYPIIKPPDG